MFGLQVVHEEVNEEQGVREAMLAVGDSGACIQLLAPLNDDSPIVKFLARSGEGVQQVAYGVDDVAAASDTLRAAGLRLLYDEPRRGTAGSRINFIHPKDAGGVLVELVQAPSRPDGESDRLNYQKGGCMSVAEGRQRRCCFLLPWLRSGTR